MHNKHTPSQPNTDCGHGPHVKLSNVQRNMGLKLKVSGLGFHQFVFFWGGVGLTAMTGWCLQKLKAKLCTVIYVFYWHSVCPGPRTAYRILENHMNDVFHGMANWKHVEFSGETKKIVFVGAREAHDWKFMRNESCSRKSARWWFARFSWKKCKTPETYRQHSSKNIFLRSRIRNHTSTPWQGSRSCQSLFSELWVQTFLALFLVHLGRTRWCFTTRVRRHFVKKRSLNKTIK